MDNFTTDQILTACILAAVAILLFLRMGGQSLHKFLQNAAIWALIFVGAIAAVGLWDDISDDLAPRQAVFDDQARVELPLARDGHYYMTLDINGVPVDFVVDTGASQIVLTKEDAAQVGLNLDDLNFFGRALTANGEVRTAPVRLDEVSVGSITDRRVPAFVNEGELFQSLLGMSYLNRWDKIEIGDGKLVLSR